MLYMKHDFFKNILEAIKANDNAFVTDIIINEVAMLVVFERGKVVEVINSAGLKARDNDSEETLGNILIDNGKKNGKLVELLAKTIINNHDLDKNLPTANYNAAGTVRETRQTAETIIPLNNRNALLVKSLGLSLKDANRDLLMLKIKSWRKLKKGNISAAGDDTGYTKETRKKFYVNGFWSGLLLTGVIVTAGYFIGKAFVKRHGRLKLVKDGVPVPPAVAAAQQIPGSVTPTSTPAPTPAPAKPVGGSQANVDLD